VVMIEFPITSMCALYILSVDITYCDGTLYIFNANNFSRTAVGRLLIQILVTFVLFMLKPPNT
jgi:hypothetical protein